MNYNFDKVINRRNTECIKFDALKERFGTEDLIPMWVADMDFAIAEPIVDAIKQRAEHPVLGYAKFNDSYYNAIVHWMKNKHNWTIEKEWICFTPGVVAALNYAVQAFSNLGDEIIIQTPVYAPFSKVIKFNGRTVVNNPLKYENNNYTMDFDDLKRKITSRTKMLFLCNPHNPVGRVWTLEELEILGEICIENNIIIVSDDIHFDLIYSGYNHKIIASINKTFEENSIICTAPSKTFNIAGLKTSNVIIANKELRKRFKITLENNAISGANVFGIEALKAAYYHCDDWLSQLMVYLEDNLNYILNFMENYIPKIKAIKPQGTFLVWLDCSSLNMSDKEIKEFFVEKCKIGCDEGTIFGEEGKYFMRMNIACSREIIKEALNRIKIEVDKLK
ncbi:MAG: pyridoxal phosphate-dependent aminotransferase [Clostridium argentinense]|uniref:cysteine-S-conjugate beta-lyase n=1 Tax=Clostridium faecium TaxID=2762223 RepID=A0ABR8YND1_9CLOT|nr:MULTISPECIES: MalY/PatB family protein [Clostridium]MBD8045711.1 pyridoxal phosphate-dependent aminotransferase [Clostridium faecium]MBS5823984.1 pyridoxal phosphate-dependent aminotransferase [Clostridium argentinense]MDU1348870.1 MalY/PatB family protein [Clostridium argentinense]